MENPIKNGMIWGENPPIFGNIHFWGSVKAPFINESPPGPSCLDRFAFFFQHRSVSLLLFAGGLSVDLHGWCVSNLGYVSNMWFSICFAYVVSICPLQYVSKYVVFTPLVLNFGFVSCLASMFGRGLYYNWPDCSLSKTDVWIQATIQNTCGSGPFWYFQPPFEEQWIYRLTYPVTFWNGCFICFHLAGEHLLIW